MIDWHLLLGIFSGLLAIFAVVPYIKDILHGTTRPNVVSWSLWVLLLLISIFAQISSGASWSVVLLIGDLVGTSSIVVVCLMGYGYGQYGKVEWICLILFVLALVSWKITNTPVLAIIFAVLADLMASVPTVVKAYRDPWSEASSGWFLITFAAALGIISTTIWNLPNLLFPAYILLVNGLIGCLSFFGRRLKR